MSFIESKTIELEIRKNTIYKLMFWFTKYTMIPYTTKPW
jgi:hypothetical protein